MKYPDDFIDKVICGDCLEVMKHIPDGAVDLVLTDPPYGIGISGQKLNIGKNPKHDRKYHEDYGWDRTIPDKEYFNEIKRVSKHHIIFGANYFNEYLSQGNKGWIIWDKGQRGLTMSDCEIAYSTHNCPTRILTYNRVEIQKDGSCHPTQKPLQLIKNIISSHSIHDHIILDPFLGSGTTAVACKQLGRRYIGIEINPEYCNIAEQRLAQEELF